MIPLSTYINESLKKLGQGVEGTVYDLGDGKVKKVFHKDRVPLTYQLLKSATDMGVIYALPKVYEVGEDYIIRENCKPGTPKCKEYWKVMNQVPAPKSTPKNIWQLVQDGIWWKDFKTGKGGSKWRMSTPGIMGEVIDWLLRLQYELSQIKPGHGLGDLAEKNLGETEDGRIVLMDF